MFALDGARGDPVRAGSLRCCLFRSRVLFRLTLGTVQPAVMFAFVNLVAQPRELCLDIVHKREVRAQGTVVGTGVDKLAYDYMAASQQFEVAQVHRFGGHDV